jgi:hypothetical protein
MQFPTIASLLFLTFLSFRTARAVHTIGFSEQDLANMMKIADPFGIMRAIVMSAHSVARKESMPDIAHVISTGEIVPGFPCSTIICALQRHHTVTTQRTPLHVYVQNYTDVISESVEYEIELERKNNSTAQTNPDYIY